MNHAVWLISAFKSSYKEGPICALTKSLIDERIKHHNHKQIEKKKIL